MRCGNVNRLVDVLRCTLCVFFALACTACVSDAKVVVQRGPTQQVAAAGATACEGPFAPVSMRVHPLTHIDSPPAGQRGDTTLVLHMEMRDAYGDLVKGLGRLDVELSRSTPAGVLVGGIAGGGFEDQPAVAWQAAEMLDAAENARRFEWDTRTYRVRLSAPAWVGEWLRNEAVRAGAPAKLRVRVSMTGGQSASGGVRVLQDTFVLEP
jgi:hypothetical protein